MKVVEQEKDALEQGISLFNDGKYFEAHEAWDGPWLGARDEEEKQFYRGLIMAAGAFQHYRRRECAGAAALLEKSIPLLQNGVDSHPNLRMIEFIRALDGLKAEFSGCSYRLSDESLPKIARIYIHC